jgi:hypothetical protein
MASPARASANFALSFVAALAVSGMPYDAVAAPVATAEGSATAQQPAEGVAVVAVGQEAHDEAIVLARAVYESQLRPNALDEPRARVIAGYPLPDNASRSLRELASFRASLTAEEAKGSLRLSTAQLLTSIAEQTHATALLLVIVEAHDAGTPAVYTSVAARLFLAGAEDLDAARYAPDANSTPHAWTGLVRSLEARFPAPARRVAPKASTEPLPLPVPAPRRSTPFYASAWFWGALGGAALLGTAFYFATRDPSSDTIRLRMDLPH